MDDFTELLESQTDVAGRKLVSCGKRKNRIIIWGTGGTALNFLDQKVFYRNCEIIAFADNDSEKWGNVFWSGIPIVSPKECSDIEFDRIVICSLYAEDIRKQLINELALDEAKIVDFKEMADELCPCIIQKYQDSAKEDIQHVLSYYKQNGFHIYGSYNGKIGEKFWVERDKDNMPYVWLEGKRMYYPRTYRFQSERGMECVYDILHEQKSGSPHLYIRDDVDIQDGSVIVDAGVCEGNFALRYVEKAKKVYLIESDPVWIEALHRTFYDWKNRVVICNKYLTRYDSSHTVTLDELVTEDQIDFLKMDIEGAEVDALLGGKRVLRSGHGKCAVCSYHHRNDEEDIKLILELFGYQTSTSEGYMFYTYDDHIADTLDFRKGIVYGDK